MGNSFDAPDQHPAPNLESINISDRPFDDFRVGESVSFVTDVTAERIDLFAASSGDHNQLHTDDSYAATTRFKKRVAHGLLVIAPISTLAGHYFPGKRSLLLEVFSRFINPVFLGDRLTYLATIVQASRSVKTLKVKVDVTNQEGEIVVTGTYTSQMLQELRDEEKS